MLDVFITNFDSVSASGYDWLKRDKCTYTYTSCTMVSVDQAISGYDYCANAFYQESGTNLVKLKNYSLVSGTYQLKYSATHSKVPGYSVESSVITVQI